MAESDRPEQRTADLPARPAQEQHAHHAAMEPQHTTRSLPLEEPWVRSIARAASRPLDSSTWGDEGGGGW